MIKKTYVRVITLLLVALMILGVMAPAFTSYAASELLVISTQKDVTATGTPDESKLAEGTHNFQVVKGSSDDDLKLQHKMSSENQYQELSDGVSFASGNKSVTYGGVTFSPSGSNGGDKWTAGAKFSITVQSVSSNGEAQIIASTVSRSDRIRKGTAISITATILDTSQYSDYKSICGV